MIGRFSVIIGVLSLAGPAFATDDVVKTARKYADGGKVAEFSETGVPEEIRFRDERILSKGKSGTYCSGLTFAVVMKVAQERKLCEQKSVKDIRKFQHEWYGSTEGKEIKEKQCVQAMINLGIGKEIEAKDVQEGDFIQFFRTEIGFDDGHSAVFLSWIERDGKRIGFRFRSSQKATKGIGDAEEYFSDIVDPPADKPHKVVRARFYAGRLNYRQKRELRVC